MKFAVGAIAILISLAAHADVLLLNAIYEVPVDTSMSPDALKYNRFLVPEYKIDQSITDAEVMSLILPYDLTAGRPIAVEMTVVKKEGLVRTLEGKRGSAVCDGPWSAQSCSFTFKELGLDPNEVTMFITEKYGHNSKARVLTEIATRFSTDPIGTGTTAPLNHPWPGFSEQTEQTTTSENHD